MIRYISRLASGFGSCLNGSSKPTLTLFKELVQHGSWRNLALRYLPQPAFTGLAGLLMRELFTGRTLSLAVTKLPAFLPLKTNTSLRRIAVVAMHQVCKCRAMLDIGCS